MLSAQNTFRASGYPRQVKSFKSLTEEGMGTALLAKYSSMRKYFSLFVRLRFAVQKGSAFLLEAIEIVRALDDGTLKKLPRATLTC